MATPVFDKVCVIGDGPMGYTLANLIAANKKCRKLCLYSFDEKIFSFLKQNRRHPYFEDLKDHPSTMMHEDVVLSNDYMECVKGAELYILALPSQVIRPAIKQLKQYLRKSSLLLHTIKGLEPHSGKRVSQVILEETGDMLTKDNVLVLSGANIAGEMLLGNLATTEIACIHEGNAKKVMRLLHSQSFRPYYNRDVIGVEFAGVLKNVLAITVGIVIGHTYVKNAKFLRKDFDIEVVKEWLKDDAFRMKMKSNCANTIAALNSRGSADAVKFALLHGAEEHTYGSFSQSWAADKDTSTYGDARNVTFGMMVGVGYTVDEAIVTLDAMGKHVEGLHTCKELYHIAKKEKLDVPLFTETYKILFEKKPVAKALSDFMKRPLESIHD